MPNAKTMYIPVGSGHVYATEFSGTIPADNVIEVESNRLGYVSEGSVIEYQPSFVTYRDDMGLVSRTKLTSEEATFKAGLIAWTSADMDKFASTARITEADGHRTIKIGGMDNDSGKRWLIRFHHPDAKYGDVRLTVVGTQAGGFTLTYKNDEAAKMALEIHAEPSDNEGTLILMDETLPSA